jgi:hypothetical protein
MVRRFGTRRIARSRPSRWWRSADGTRKLIDTFEITDSEVRWMHGFAKDLVVVD